jgi:uroporphyrinogen-III decarboxylase
LSQTEKLHRLVDQVRAVNENQAVPAWGELWDQSAFVNENISMFAYPNPIIGTGRAPYVFFPDANFFARLFEYDLEQVFTDALTWVCFTLEQTLWLNDHLNHDGSVDKSVIINQLGFFPPSLFGMKILYAADAVPWIKEPVIRKKTDFLKLSPPDFYSSGLSPLVHRMYEQTKAFLPDDFHVEFTTWLTGPFSLLFHLRGPMELAMDILEDPGFVHEMMEFATDCMVDWWHQRAKFLGQDTLDPLVLGNDEVGVPLIAPHHYEEFVLPYELRLAAEFGGIDYWHSCSDITRLLPHLAKIPNLRMIDVGPWTSLHDAVDLFGKRAGSSIMKRLHPVSEILMADENGMRSRLLQIKAACYDVSFMLFFDGINVLHSVEECVEKIILLDQVCHEVFHLTPQRPSGAPESWPNTTEES